MADAEQSVLKALKSAWFVLVAGIAVVIIDPWARHRRIRAIDTTRVRARLGTTATPEEAVVESLTGDLGPLGRPARVCSSSA